MVFFCGQLFFLALVVFWVGGPNCRVFDLASHLRIFVKRCGLAIWVGANGTKPRRLDARYWLSGSRWRWGGAAAGGAGGGGGAQYAYPMLAAAARRPGAPVSHSRKASRSLCCMGRTCRRGDLPRLVQTALADICACQRPMCLCSTCCRPCCTSCARPPRCCCAGLRCARSCYACVRCVCLRSTCWCGACWGGVFVQGLAHVQLVVALVPLVAVARVPRVRTENLIWIFDLSHLCWT